MAMIRVKHTTMDWHYGKIGDDPDQWSIGDEFGRMIGLSYHGEAIARLIAAAPLMLKALENIENDDEHMPETAWRLIQDAIAKAKGETP